MSLLICEGTCNYPTIEHVQTMIKEVTRTRIADGKCCVGDDRLWDLQRSLKYTVHTPVATMHAHEACTVCGHVRRFGA